jgi:hypothetical protein
MKTTTGSNYSQPPNNYPPSVPLCVYRELTAELQAVQAKLDVVTNHNQKLAQENQQLRQEITKVIQSCLELQKLVATSAPSPPPTPPHHQQVTYQPQPQPTPRNNEVKYQPQPQTKPQNNEVTYTQKPTVTKAPPRQQANRPRPKAVIKAKPPENRRQESTKPVVNTNFPISETVSTEEKKVNYSTNPHFQTKGLNGLWLIITIILIMVTGFAAGYLIVRPLFQNHIQPSTIQN